MSEEVKTEKIKLSPTILVHRALWGQVNKELQETKAQLKQKDEALKEARVLIFFTNGFTTDLQLRAMTKEWLEKHKEIK